jgi:hypothetical protein
VREAPENLGGNRRAEVGVQLGEASFEHELSLERAPTPSVGRVGVAAQLTHMGHASKSSR